jgi:hypothetical protein
VIDMADDDDADQGARGSWGHGVEFAGDLDVHGIFFSVFAGSRVHHGHK